MAPTEASLCGDFDGDLNGHLGEIDAQFGMLAVLILLPLQMLSGNSSPRESMPEAVQYAMLLAPTTHFVMLSQSILFRAADITVVWPQFLAPVIIGTVFFAIAALQFRKSVAQAV